MQFARDAHMAEGWMIAQEPYLKNENLGVCRFNPRFQEGFREINENDRNSSREKNFLTHFFTKFCKSLVSL